MDQSAFFSNTGCPYFPCHQTDDPYSFNCLFCYCPLDALGEQCGGRFSYTENGIKDCSDCVIPHRADAAAYIRTRFPEIAERAGIRPSPLRIEHGDTLTGREAFDDFNRRIAPPDEAAGSRCRAHWDSIAKPLNGLGLLEKSVMRIAALTGSENVSIGKRAVLVLCADSGIVAEGVTQTDASVTETMAKRISEGRSSVCMMAKSAGADVYAVDIGMNHPVEGVMDMSVGRGTANMSEGPAMTDDQAYRAIANGIKLAKACAERGYRILVTGEMGIGNTSAASAVASVLLGLPAEAVTGRGAGLSDDGLERKRDAIRRAIAVNAPDPDDAFDVLKKLGGFELAGLAGVYIGAAMERIPVLIDGFPSSVAALAASRLVPNCIIAMLASHCSAEPAAKAVLSELELSPLLFADLKLGEGTGAVCMLPLLDAALSVYNGSVSFDDAGIGRYVPQQGDER